MAKGELIIKSDELSTIIGRLLGEDLEKRGLRSIAFDL